MNFSSFLLFSVLLGACAAPSWTAAQSVGKNVVTSERARAELMVHAPEGFEPGKPVWVGLQLAHQPGWHSYWKNSGDSGLPTQLQWTLPAGVVAGADAGALHSSDIKNSCPRMALASSTPGQACTTL